VGFLQAQDRRAAVLAVGARAGGPTAAGVEAAMRAPNAGAAPPIVRTWAMRGTLHLLAAEDLPVVLAVYGPLLLARGARRLTQLGLPPPLAERSTRATAEILAAEGPLTRHELAERLRARGLPVGPKGQAPVHVVARAAAAGVLVEVGDDRYAAPDLEPLPARDAALRTLARRYLDGHAPASLDDFARWSGLPAADARAAWPGDAAPPDDEPPPAGVRLLPAYDEWLLGWAGVPRAPQYAPGGGLLRPVAIADGVPFATWRLDGARGVVALAPFARVPGAGVAEEVARLSAFLERSLRLAR